MITTGEASRAKRASSNNYNKTSGKLSTLAVSGAKRASSTANKAPVSAIKRAKGGPTFSKKMVPNYDPYEDDSGDDYSTTCSFTDDSDVEPSSMDKLKFEIDLAKAHCLGSMDHNASKFINDTKSDAEKRFDKLYKKIQKYKLKK
ncbi:hypothetical protein BDA96_03G175700 [Sorghum bicolor]|uniref:Uncharacterized protein n=1 Tax=Sorghum bicolor TaxID=4558 RepID=A0A921UMJ7_SORBI|nr:hypothetical protein BDA96_03G175700 [Sorghum bicolor]